MSDFLRPHQHTKASFQCQHQRFTSGFLPLRTRYRRPISLFIGHRQRMTGARCHSSSSSNSSSNMSSRFDAYSLSQSHAANTVLWYVT